MATEMRVVIFKGLSKWVAQCLESDIAAQADRLEDLPAKLLKALEAEVEFSKRKGKEAFRRLPQAPDRYFSMWRGAMTLPAERKEWTNVPPHILPKIADGQRSAVP